jgi:hypothetical protein
MKKISISFCVFLIMIVVSAFSQDPEQDKIRYPGKDQSKLPNDVNISYGLGTVYLFTTEVDHSYDMYSSYNSSDRTEISSPGTLMVGYNRMMNKVIMIGFLASYINCNYKRTYTDYEGNFMDEATFNDNLLSGIAKVTFNYVNKPKVRVYSAAGMGITVDLSNVQGDLPQSVSESARKILFAGQVTFMGIRFGRTFGGFCEFGFGTNAIISAGLNYQFSD